MLKNFKGLIIVLSIETIFYIIESPVDLEMFFLFFGLIFAVLFVYNIFSHNHKDPLHGVGGKSGTGTNFLFSKQSEELYGTDKFTLRFGGGIVDKSNILLLIFAVLNFAAYIYVMPK